MRVLHLVKTVDGAAWAVHQAVELVKLGVDVHVALPSATGRMIEAWRRSGATIHEAALDFPAREPWLLRDVLRRARELVSKVRPDIIHSHFFGTTQIIRYALGKNHPLPRVYQVAGPLHLEHAAFRKWELSTAGPGDRWIASSRCIEGLYREAGIEEGRVFHSYYGTRVEEFSARRTGELRSKLGIAPAAIVIGNINFMYPPKRFLGQRVGLKCHEDIIDALGPLLARRRNWCGVLVGGAWGASERYLQSLRRRARRFGSARFYLPGRIGPDEAARVWPDFDLAVHVPMSENCGGVLEPMLAGVPVVASDVGGISELVQDGKTGRLVPPRNPRALSTAVSSVIASLPHCRELALRARERARTLFDVRRTSAEVLEIYGRILIQAGVR